MGLRPPPREPHGAPRAPRDRLDLGFGAVAGSVSTTPSRLPPRRSAEGRLPREGRGGASVASADHSRSSRPHPNRLPSAPPLGCPRLPARFARPDAPRRERSRAAWGSTRIQTHRGSVTKPSLPVTVSIARCRRLERARPAAGCPNARDGRPTRGAGSARRTTLNKRSIAPAVARSFRIVRLALGEKKKLQNEGLHARPPLPPRRGLRARAHGHRTRAVSRCAAGKGWWRRPPPLASRAC